MRSSTTKINARYRGPTYTSQYTNAFNEILHDLRYLFRTSTEHEGVDGHRAQINSNLFYIIDGSSTPSSQKTPRGYNNIDMIGNTTEVEQEVEHIRKELIEWNL